LALLLDPKYAVARYNLAISLGIKGKYDEAAEQCRIYLAANPNDADMLTNFGIILLKQGKTNEAIETIKKALRIDPGYEKARGILNSVTAGQTQN
jgi:Tfp pilus assembly protein PilF